MNAVDDEVPSSSKSHAMTRKKKPVKPVEKPKSDPYSRDQDIRLDLPYQFMLLCKLVQVPPERMLRDFMTNVGRDSWDRSSNEAQRTTALAYFMECGYGQDFYTPEDLRQIFWDLDAIGGLWPRGAEMKMIDLQAKWRDKYHKYWFKKWYRKVRRRK